MYTWLRENPLSPAGQTGQPGRRTGILRHRLIGRPSDSKEALTFWKKAPRDEMYPQTTTNFVARSKLISGNPPTPILRRIKESLEK